MIYNFTNYITKIESKLSMVSSSRLRSRERRCWRGASGLPKMLLWGIVYWSCASLILYAAWKEFLSVFQCCLLFLCPFFLDFFLSFSPLPTPSLPVLISFLASLLFYSTHFHVQLHIPFPSFLYFVKPLCYTFWLISWNVSIASIVAKTAILALHVVNSENRQLKSTSFSHCCPFFPMCSSASSSTAIRLFLLFSKFIQMRLSWLSQGLVGW